MRPSAANGRRKRLPHKLWAVVALVALAAPSRSQHWEVQYFYDKAKSSLSIQDIQFVSASRGVAVGAIHETEKHAKPVAVVTADGGAHWQVVPLRETPPLSVFLLNENLGWMVAGQHLWHTTEAGKSWSEVSRFPVPILRVYFADESNGWAVGFKKTVLETHNGGRGWERVAAAAEPSGEAKYSTYSWIAFATPQSGLISGWNQPPRRFEPKLPEWIDPQATLDYRDRPHLSYSLVTRDGGKTWKSSSASLFGDISRIRFGKQNNGLGLVEYSDAFRFPSEVYKVEWTSGKSQTVYRNPNMFVSDIWLTPDGTAYLAGITMLGQTRLAPGKVQVLRSKDLSAWTEMEVDYRAVAHRATLAAADDQNLWVATDNGMILKLVR